MYYFKKTQIRYSEADEEKRKAFEKDLGELKENNPEKSVIYVDETGVDKYLYRSNVRAKRGVKIYSKIRGRKYERTSIVAGKSENKIFAPLLYNGTADSGLFELWFKDWFCPEAAGNIVVMDNASIHRKQVLHEIAKEHDITLIFQPPYSPDLNKIEKFWAWLKKELQSALKFYTSLTDAICYCFQLK